MEEGVARTTVHQMTDEANAKARKGENAKEKGRDVIAQNGRQYG